MGDEQVIPGADPMHLLGQKTPNLERIVDIHGRIEEAGVLQVGKGHVKNDLAGGVLRGPSIGGTAGYAIPTRPRSAQSVEVEYDPLATGMGFWANSVPDGGGKNGEYTVDPTSKIGLVGKEQG